MSTDEREMAAYYSAMANAHTELIPDFELDEDMEILRGSM